MANTKESTFWDDFLRKHLEDIREYPFELDIFPRYHRFHRISKLYGFENIKHEQQSELKKAIADKINSAANPLTIDQESRNLYACGLIQDMMSSLRRIHGVENKLYLEEFKQKNDLEVLNYEKATPWYKKIDWPYFWRLAPKAAEIKRLKIQSEHIGMMLGSEQKKESNKFEYSKAEWPIDKVENLTVQKVIENFKKIEQLLPSSKIKYSIAKLQDFLSPYLSILTEIETNNAIEISQRQEPVAELKLATANEEQSKSGAKINSLEDARKIIMAEALKRAEDKPLTEENLQSAYRSLSLQYHPDKQEGDEEQFKKLSQALEELKNSLMKGEHHIKYIPKQTASSELAELLIVEQKIIQHITSELNAVKEIFAEIKKSYQKYTNEKNTLNHVEKRRNCEEHVKRTVGLMMHRLPKISDLISNQKKRIDEYFGKANCNNDISKNTFSNLGLQNEKLFQLYISLEMERENCYKIWSEALSDSKFNGTGVNNKNNPGLNTTSWSASNCWEVPVTKNTHPVSSIVMGY